MEETPVRRKVNVIVRNISPLLVLALISGIIAIDELYFETYRGSDATGSAILTFITAPCLVLNVIINLLQKNYKTRMVIQIITVSIIILFVAGLLGGF